MKIALWAAFVIVFVWIVSVIVTIINPGVIFGPINIITSILLAIVILSIVEIIR